MASAYQTALKKKDDIARMPEGQVSGISLSNSFEEER